MTITNNGLQQLLIRVSLVRAQVGEPDRYKSGHSIQVARFHLCDALR